MLGVEFVFMASVLGVIGLASMLAKLGSGHRTPPPIVLHYPASGPSPVALVALTDRSVILDRALAVLWQRRERVTDPAEVEQLARLAALGAEDLRVGDTVSAELSAPRPQNLPLAVKVRSPEYAAMVRAVAARGVSDPAVVAEALLAATHHAVAVFATVDPRVAGQLELPNAQSPYRGIGGPEMVWFERQTIRIRVI